MVKLYVDGQPESVADVKAKPINTATDEDVSIGTYQAGSAPFFNGLIDDVRVYRRALTQGEIYGLSTSKTLMRFGVITDLHYADRDKAGSRYYRDSLSKAAESIALFNEQKVDFVVELGDFKDQGVPSSEASSISYLQTVEGVFQQFNGPRYHALGNHDMDSISKAQFLDNVENTGIEAGRSYYSFDVKGVHCAVLDANFNSDGSDYDHGNFDWRDENIPDAELDWLKDDLAAAKGTVIIFLHQCLDGEGEYYFNNGVNVRKILEESGKVAAVFQGHHHAGGYNLINGIHYYTFPAMCEGPFPENNAYTIVDVLEDRIIVTGYPVG
ncbi:MAG: metallophosphoesterase [Phycisphaerae bacterium]|nr:metallophosphoesterase [Phycisphaerae bacterium]